MITLPKKKAHCDNRYSPKAIEEARKHTQSGFWLQEEEKGEMYLKVLKAILKK